MSLSKLNVFLIINVILIFFTKSASADNEVRIYKQCHLQDLLPHLNYNTTHNKNWIVDYFLFFL